MNNLPILRDKKGKIIREFDILRVFHFEGRRRGKGREKHCMYKIATIKEYPQHGRQWWFYHSAKMGDGWHNGYWPYEKGFGKDQTLDRAEVISSPATLHEQFCKGCRECSREWGKDRHPPSEEK